MPLKEVLEQGQVSLSPVETLGKKGLVEIVLLPSTSGCDSHKRGDEPKADCFDQGTGKSPFSVETNAFGAGKAGTFPRCHRKRQDGSLFKHCPGGFGRGETGDFAGAGNFFDPTDGRAVSAGGLGSSKLYPQQTLCRRSGQTQWEKARRGEISIMIGPRSALFTAFFPSRACDYRRGTRRQLQK